LYRKHAVAVDELGDAGIDRHVDVERGRCRRGDECQLAANDLFEVGAPQRRVDQVDVAEAGDLFWFEPACQRVLDVDDGDLRCEGVEDVGVDIGFGGLTGHRERLVQVAGDDQQALRAVDRGEHPLAG